MRKGCGRKVRGINDQERGRSQYNPYYLASKYGSFVAESIVYPKENFMALYCDQCESVSQKNTSAGWLNGSTPTSGFTLNKNGRAVIGTTNDHFKKIKAGLLDYFFSTNELSKQKISM